MQAKLINEPFQLSWVVVELLEMLAALAIGGLTGPEPIGPADWITLGDNPRDLSPKKQGVVGFQLIVTAEGAVHRCDILTSSGFADLDRMTCQLMMKRGRFRPGKDETGAPIWSVYRNRLFWVASGYSVRPQPADPDLTLQVNKLPPKVKDPVMLRLQIVVTRDGLVAACREENGARVLGDLACHQISNGIKFNIVTDRNGHPQRSLQSRTVKFTTQIKQLR